MASHDLVNSAQVDLDEKRRNALAEIDNAKFSWFHVRTIVVAGIGFFTDAYDLFAVNFVTVMLGYVYYNGGTLPTHLDLGIKISAQCGTFIGQLLFGWLGDLWGRKRMYGVVLMIIMTSTLGSALCGDSFAVSVTGSLILWRVILGIGIGGDYPVSAVISSEFAGKNHRGAMIGAVFAMQGFGILSAAIVSTVILAIYKPHIQGDILYIDYCWRLLIGIGAVPALVALYFRLTISETPRYTIDIERNIQQAADDIAVVLGNRNQSTTESDDEDNVQVDAPKHSWQDFKSYFGKWDNGKVLLGTSLSWFFLDIAFYGLGLNNSIILKNIGFASSSDPFTSLWHISIGNILIAILGTVPGYWFTVGLVDIWGRKPIQLMGFGVLTALFLVLGVAYHQILNTSVDLFIVIFTLSQFFQNFGPNTTTFIIPGEVFPTRYRSTGHGISAASGKFGAIIAQVGFFYVKDIGGSNHSINTVITICAPIMFLGVFSTLLIPETKNRSLEELSNEQQIGFVTTTTTAKKTVVNKEIEAKS